ncbi:MAG: peptidylprolyl isomerase [Planctomycetes bacterium]|jgi:hypothetical protein|nr:peptidylprolyl isomerase [Planctomycetota bacterium]
MKTKQAWTVAALAAVVTIVVVIVLVSQSPAPKSPGGAVPPASETGAPAASAEVVARIGDYTITRPSLEERLVRALQPQETEFAAEIKPVTVEGTLLEMLAEKAMSMEGRKLGYLEDEMIAPRLEEYRQGLLARKVQEGLFPEAPAVTAAEVDQVLKERPQLTREQATAMAQRTAALKILDQFYQTLVAKFHLKKVEGNFAQAAQIHQRLLLRPVEARGPGEYWIKNSQVRSELTEQERKLPLATYDGGQFTLGDWFQVICSMAPPRRPGDLGTPAGVERVLDWGVRAPIFVAEAKVRGYDKDEKLCADVRQREDMELLYKVQQEKTKDISEPAPDPIKAHYEKNPERFAQAATLKVSQIWCPDLPAAQKLKATLDQGADFEAVRKEHSLQKEPQEPYNISATGEGIFWPELWQAQPNQTIGPLRGFYGSGLKWRIVKVLEKTPAKVQPYSEQLANSIKWAIMGEQRQRILEDCQKQLLAKYPHEIFREKLQGMDPLEIATQKGDQ